MPEAYAVLFELAKALNKAKAESGDTAQLAYVLKHLGGILGILQLDPTDYLQGRLSDNSEQIAEIEGLIKQRNDARANKDWAAADAARDALKALNIELEDGPEGTSWRKV